MYTPIQNYIIENTNYYAYDFNFGVFLNAGLAVMILMGPLNAIVARKLKKYQLLQMKNKDQVQYY
jgi:hypothetical protein